VATVTRLLGTSLTALCLAFGLVSACGGGEFAAEDENEGGEGSGGSVAPHGGGGAASAGKAGKGGAAGTSSTGGKAGQASGGAAGVAGTGGSSAGGSGGGSAGTGMAGGAMAGAAGSGGNSAGPCADKQGAECLACCSTFGSIDSYVDRSYTCGCSDPCYPICEMSCNGDVPRTLACHSCVIDGLVTNAGNLCLNDSNACNADPACKSVTECLRTCL
jgi:hypothetical protein